MPLASAHPLFALQETLYASRNYTRRRLHRERWEWVTSAIARHAAGVPGRAALEWGPGAGVYLPTLAQHFAEVTAADVETAYLSGLAPLASQLPGLHLVTDDIQRSTLPANAFGLVLCSEVLEHVPDPETALHTIARLLRPGGVAIVTTPQRYSVMELCCRIALLPGVIQLARLAYREPVLPTGHISLRSRPALRRAIAETGLAVREEMRLGLYLPLVAELGGERGGRWIEALEHRCTGTPLDHLFWTQAYVLRKSKA